MYQQFALVAVLFYAFSASAQDAGMVCKSGLTMEQASNTRELSPGGTATTKTDRTALALRILAEIGKKVSDDPFLSPKLVESEIKTASDGVLASAIVLAVTDPSFYVPNGEPLSFNGQSFPGTLVQDGLIIVHVAHGDGARWLRAEFGGLDGEYGPCFLTRSGKFTTPDRADVAVFGKPR